MDYSRADLADRLAAEYVMGTLRGPARRRMQTLLPAHPALRDAVLEWQARLMPLADDLPPVPASPQVWRGIEHTLFGPTRSTPWWQRLGLWQGLASAGGAAALALGVLLMLMQPPLQAPVMVVLLANPEQVAAAGQQPARFVASVSGDGRALVLQPLASVVLTPRQALELWALPMSGAPRSLGSVSPTGLTTVLGRELLQGLSGFAVSLEPAGGSPTGQPTGPILSLGKLRT